MIAIYVRLSKEDETSNSINNQLREGKEFAKKYNEPYKVYNEGEGISGTLDISQRPQLQLLMTDIKEGIIKSVWMRNQNRLDRNSLTFAIFVDVAKKNNIDVYFGSNDKLDFNDPTTLLTTSILSNLNQYQANLISAQTKKSIHDNVKEGKVHGIIAYGYTRDKDNRLVINEDEAEVIKKMYELRANGVSYGEISTYLNDNNIPTRYNSFKGTITGTKYGEIIDKSDIKWGVSSVTSLLRNPIYKGVRKFGGKEYEAPIIVDPLLWQKAQDVRPKKKGRKTHRYLLNGILVCGVCGKDFSGRPRRDRKGQYREDGYNFYRCATHKLKGKKCGNRTILTTHLERFIWNRFFKDEYLTEKVKEYLKNDDLHNQLDDLKRSLEVFDKEINKHTKEKQNAVRMAIKGLLAEEDIQPEIKRIESKIKTETDKKKKVNEQIRFLERSAVNEKDISNEIGEVKDTTDFNTKKEIVKKYIKEIYISYPPELKMYVLNIEFNLPIKEELYFIPTNYHFAIDIFDRILIPIKKDVKQPTQKEWDKMQTSLAAAFEQDIEQKRLKR